MPTTEQALSNVFICQWLSNCYLDIHLFRYDAKREEIFILAGKTLGITVFKDGLWRFDDATDA